MNGLRTFRNNSSFIFVFYNIIAFETDISNTLMHACARACVCVKIRNGFRPQFEQIGFYLCKISFCFSIIKLDGKVFGKTLRIPDGLGRAVYVR